MAARLTHDNVGHNPSAAYLFLENGEGFAGKRLSLIVGNEEVDAEKIKAIRRRYNLPIGEEDCQYLVHFHIEGVARCSAMGDETGGSEFTSPLAGEDTVRGK